MDTTRAALERHTRQGQVAVDRHMRRLGRSDVGGQLLDAHQTTIRQAERLHHVEFGVDQPVFAYAHLLVEPSLDLTLSTRSGSTGRSLRIIRGRHEAEGAGDVIEAPATQRPLRFQSVRQRNARGSRPSNGARVRGVDPVEE